MRRNKRVVESLAVLGLAGALTITAIPYSNVGVKEVESGFETNGIAGRQDKNVFFRNTSAALPV